MAPHTPTSQRMQSPFSPSAFLEKGAPRANGRLLTLGLLCAQGRGLSRGRRHGTIDARAATTSWQKTNQLLARPLRRKRKENRKRHQTEPEISRQETQSLTDFLRQNRTKDIHTHTHKKKKKKAVPQQNIILLFTTTFVGGAFRCKPESLLDKF